MWKSPETPWSVLKAVPFSTLSGRSADSTCSLSHSLLKQSMWDYQMSTSLGSSQLLILLAKYCLTSHWLHQFDELRSASSGLWNTAKPVVDALAVDCGSRHQML